MSRGYYDHTRRLFHKLLNILAEETVTMKSQKIIFCVGFILLSIGITGVVLLSNPFNSMWTFKMWMRLWMLRQYLAVFYILMVSGFLLISIYFVTILKHLFCKTID